MSKENFALKISKFTTKDLDIIRSVIGKESFAGSSLRVDVDASTAQRLMQYWEENECAFNIKCRNKNFKSA